MAARREFFSTTTAQGIACIVGAMLALSLQDNVVKWLGATYPLHQIVLIRSVIAAFLTVMVLAALSRLHLLKTRRPGLHLIRGALLLLINSAFFFALVAMPVAEAVAMFFVAPLFIIMLSATLLGETVGPRRLFAVLLGFAGVIVIMRPGIGSFSYIGLFPVGAAAMYAVFQILTRRLGTTDSAATMAFYVQVMFIMGGIAMGLAVGDGRFAGGDDPSVNFLLRAWRLPDLEGALLLGLVGLLICGASVLLSQAYRITEAATIAPFEYIALPFAGLWSYMIWGDVPDAIALVGMALIVGSGVFVILRTERLRSNAPPSPPSD